MSLYALGPRGDAAPRAISPGYARAIDGLRAFDDLSRTLAGRRDAVVRGLQPAASAYPEPAYASPAAAGTMLGAAVAAFVGSDAGRAAIERAVSAAGGLLKGLFAGGGPTQLPLPFE
jgi:hypothetical protein